MAKLFKEKSLKKELANFHISNIDKKLSIIKKWGKLYKDGTLKNRNEEKTEQAFNSDIFEKVLDYRNFTNVNDKGIYSLEIKETTETTAEKPDVLLGIFKNNDEKPQIKCVVELKSTGISLDKAQRSKGNLSPVEQGFNYKNKYRGCEFVIASNFNELRLYKNNQLDFEEWTLENLLDEKDDYFQFKKFYFLLSEKHLIREKTVNLLLNERVEQEKITKKFYQDYKVLRENLIKDIVKNNSISRENFAEYVEKSQKIIDRVIFVAFCEDLDLLPENILNKVLESARKNDLLSHWATLKGFFNAIDSGSDKLGIPDGYNGELFKPDPLLDSLKISDETCEEFLKLGKYDFSEDLNVNILGHIFEQSISDLEEIKNLGLEKISKISRRKQTGIFYTPEYIVDYIVRNSVGKWLKDKEFEILAKNGVKEILKDKNYEKRLRKAYEEYQTVLQNIKVVDPACGSGAFLVKVFDFLLAENKRVGEIIGNIFSAENMVKDILKNNIYGVDLNAESVEITKLSLWLKTCQKGKKLQTLKNNIKCGNSLINDPELAGNKAFDWSENFAEIFENKNKQAFLVTWVTHNSRISERMVKYGVKLKDPFILSEEDRNFITEKLNEKISREKMNVLALNVLDDHVHLVIICDQKELSENIRKLKGYSSIELSRKLKLSVEGQGRQNKIWAKGSSKTFLESEKHFNNAVEYTFENHQKHKIVSINRQLQLSALTDYKTAWKDEYSMTSGFDVVVGNPPYVQLQKMGIESDKLKTQNYQTFTKTGDLYCLFYELGNQILKSRGILGFITSNKWMRANYGKPLRKYLAEQTTPLLLVDLGSGIFESATVDSNILIFEKNETEKHNLTALDLSKEKELKDFAEYKEKEVTINDLSADIWAIMNPLEKQIKKKIEKIGTPLKDWDIEINYGIRTGFNEAFIINEKKKDELIAADPKSREIIKPILRGRDIKRYSAEFANLYIILVRKNFSAEFEKKFPILYDFVSKYEDSLKKRGQVRAGSHHWIEIDNSPTEEYLEKFTKEKIIWKRIGSLIRFSYSQKKEYCLDSTVIATGNNLKYLTVLLNSKLHIRELLINSPKTGTGDVIISVQALSPLLVFNPSKREKSIFIEKADKMIELNGQLQLAAQKFLKLLQTEFQIEKIPTKLNHFWDLEFTDFWKSLKVKNISLAKKSEWMEFFETNKQTLLGISREISAEESIIDEMVFDLYDLNKKEREFISNS